MLWQLVILVIVLWMIYVRFQKRRIIQLSKCLKNDYKALPFVGHAYLFIGNGEDRMKTLQLLGRQAIKHGGMTHMWLGGKCYVVLADPVGLDIVMKTSLEKDDIMQFARIIIGNGTVFAPVSIWRPRRKVLAPTFNQKNLNQFVTIFNRYSRIMVDQLQRVAGTGPFSMWRYISTYAMDSVCGSTLGVQVNAQLQPDQSFFRAFERVCQLVAMRMFQPWLYFNFIYSVLPINRELLQCKKNLCNFINEAIVTKRTQLKQRKENFSGQIQDGELKSFLEQLIENSEDSRGYSDVELFEETMMLVMAGTDTSAVGIAFAVLMMSKHPDVQEKVYHELQQVFGDSDRPAMNEDLNRLKYLDAVIRETLRLYPPAPIVLRKVEKDVKLPSGVTLVEGCGILVHIWATNRNPEYWGDDAEFFRPERFIDSPPKHSAAFQAFSYGPRSCIGYQYAMMSGKTLLATLVRKYRILPDVHASADTPLRLSFDIMMKDVNKFTVQLETRN